MMHIEHHAQIDHVEHIQSEVAQIVVYRFSQFPARERREPRSVCAAARAHLRDDEQIVRIGVQRFTDDPVGVMRPVEIRGVDMVHTA
jgi:hypothetical protein